MTRLIEDLPGKIEEAARIDSARPFQIFQMIVVPLAALGLVVAWFTLMFLYSREMTLLCGHLQQVKSDPATGN